MSNIDDLRNFDFDNEEEDEFNTGSFEPVVQEEKRFLGMTALERMFIAIFLFLNIAVLGIALLLATNRISF
jgi:hypothetical protein